MPTNSALRAYISFRPAVKSSLARGLFAQQRYEIFSDCAIHLSSLRIKTFLPALIFSTGGAGENFSLSNELLWTRASCLRYAMRRREYDDKISPNIQRQSSYAEKATPFGWVWEISSSVWSLRNQPIRVDSGKTIKMR